MKDLNEKWLYKDLTQEIIGAAIEVHRELGSGFLEYVYELLNFGKKDLGVKEESCGYKMSETNTNDEPKRI